MRTTLALAALLVVAHGAPLDVHSEWENFKLTFGRNYASQAEHDQRQAIFVEKLKYINQHNAEHKLGLHSFTLRVNKFADLTHEEYARKLNNFKQSSAQQNVFNEAVEDVDVSALPKEVDWRKKGYVTPVKDQNPCGTCWAFSAVATMESAHFKKTGNLVSLSEQNLVQCSDPVDSKGHHYKHNCYDGGDQADGINYGIKYGVDTEESYPYNAALLNSTDAKCLFKKSDVGATFSDIKFVPPKSEAALQKAVADVGTIAVAIDASQESFEFYFDGVYKDVKCSSENLDHAVAVVGYGTTEDGEDYWLVKNSWGTWWGDEGYVKIARNKGNMCGIATYGLYAIA